MAKKDKKDEIQEKESGIAEIVKKFKQNPGIYIGSVVILILVSVTFIGGDFISGGGLSGRGGDYVFGYYDKVPIELVPGNYFTLAYDEIAANFQSQGYNPSDYMIAPTVWRYAFFRTVEHTAVMQIMKRSNYSVPQNIVDRYVTKLPEFQENGRFSPELYRRVPEARKLTIWRQMQENLTKIMFYSDYSSLLTSSGEADFIAKLSAPSRSFNMVSFLINDYPNEEYLSFAQENSKLFNSIRLSRITVRSGEREAKKILDSIKNGTTTFEDAARNHSQDMYADMGGDMGNRFYYELDREIQDTSVRDSIFGLRRDDYSGIIETDDGWSFYRVENASLKADFNDDATMDRVRTYMRFYQRGRMEDWAIAKANVFISDVNESGFENAAQARELEISSFGPLPINYGSLTLFTSLESFPIYGLSSQELTTLARNENFWKTAFSAPLNTPSKPFVYGSFVFVFLPTDEIEADESSLEYVSSGFNSLLYNYSDMLIQMYFINSERMEDMFEDSYVKYF